MVGIVTIQRMFYIWSPQNQREPHVRVKVRPICPYVSSSQVHSEGRLIKTGIKRGLQDDASFPSHLHGIVQDWQESLEVLQSCANAPVGQ